MDLLNISNNSFYIFMIIVLIFLFFFDFRESVNKKQKDSKVIRIFALIYFILTLGIFVLSMFK